MNSIHLKSPCRPNAPLERNFDRSVYVVFGSLGKASENWREFALSTQHWLFSYFWILKILVMKRLSLVLALVAFVVFSTEAQKFQLGVKGGLNIPSTDAFGFTGDVDGSGWHAGIFGLIKITKIGIQPEVLYSSYNFTDNTDNSETDFNFVTVPIIAKLYLVQGVNIQAGPQFGILLDSESKNAGITLDNTGVLKDSDLSIAVGAGVDLPFGLNISGRYLIGVSDISDQDALGEINTSTVQVSLGYALVKLGL